MKAKESHSAHPRLVIIDGYGFLFRAYHSLPPLTNPEGIPVGAIYGFINMLTKVLKSHKSDYVAVALDSGKQTFRHDIYQDYKANRPAPPDDLIPQFSIVRDAVEAFNVPAIDKQGFEADDLIATYTRHATEKGIKVTIISSDKDLMQLIDDNVVMYDAMKSKYIDSDAVFEKFGVYPDKVLDLLSLMGDSSDNVPGVPGIGAKTAAQLLNDFGSLDDILDSAHTIKQQKRRETLINNKEQAYLSKDLITLNSSVDLDLSLESLAFKEIDQDKLVSFLQQHGFKNILTKLHKEGILSTSSESQPQAIPQTVTINIKETPKKKIAVIHSANDLDSWTQTIVKSSIASLSLWIHNDKKTKQPLSVALATNIGDIAYIPLNNEKQQSQPMLFAMEETSKEALEISLSDVFDVVEKISAQDGVRIIGHDIKSWLRHSHNLWTHVMDDIMVMSYVLEGGLHDHSIAQMVEHYLEIDSTAYQLPDLKKADEAEIQDYVVRVAALMNTLHDNIRHRLFDVKLLTLYHRIEKPLIRILAGMEHTGIKVDPTMLTHLSEQFAKDIHSLEGQIHHLAGKEFNIGSPKQLGEVLFEDMKLEGGKKSKKTGSYSTDSEVLENLASQGIEIASKVVEYRTYSKLKSTYTDALTKQIASDGRVHTHYSMASVNTGRLSSSDPNLQNIPIRSDIGNQIRAVFIPKNGYKLISADYSQIELRLLAHIADIEVLKTAFIDGKDIHTATASQMFGVPIEQVDSHLRGRAKTINFGIIYGISAFGLAKRIGIGRKEAAEYIENYFIQYPGIKHYMQQAKQEAAEHGFVSTIMGRRCYIKGIYDKNHAVKQFAERAAINAPLQGSAADIIKMAMIEVEQLLAHHYPDANMLLQVHDELILEVPQEQAQPLCEKIKRVMENVISLSIPLTVSASFGDNWKEIH